MPKEKDVEYTPEYQARSPLDFFKIAPGGIGSDTAVTEQFQKASKAQEDYANSLEQRFAQPNWFNVAAGFAKPTLAGFIGSLGNAAEALGQQQEAQKSIMPTVARMRAEVAAGQLSFEQRMAQKKMFDEIKTGKIPMNEQTLQKMGEFGTETDIYKAAKDFFSTQNLRQDMVLKAMESQQSIVPLYAKLGVDFVNSEIARIRARFPELQPPPGYKPDLKEGEAPAGATSAGSSAPAPAVAPAPGQPSVPNVKIQGAPEASTVPRESQIALKTSESEQKIEQTGKTSSALSQQADAGTQMFDAASAVYKAAAKPSLTKAFGLFEQGDFLGLLGRALEDQTISEVFRNVRAQVNNLKLGDTEKSKTLSDLQSLESALASLQYQVQQGVINPTDLRTATEARSIPNIKSTQDAFLRGMARLASEGLTKYEVNQAFQQVKNKPDFDIFDWQTSKPYADVMNSSKKRNTALISNPASFTMPNFMSSGIVPSGSAESGKTKEGQSSKTPNRPAERTFNNVTYVLQPDGTYKPKGKE